MEWINILYKVLSPASDKFALQSWKPLLRRFPKKGMMSALYSSTVAVSIQLHSEAYYNHTSMFPTRASQSAGRMLSTSMKLTQIIFLRTVLSQNRQIGFCCHQIVVEIFKNLFEWCRQMRICVGKKENPEGTSPGPSHHKHQVSAYLKVPRNKGAESGLRSSTFTITLQNEFPGRDVIACKAVDCSIILLLLARLQALSFVAKTRSGWIQANCC